MELAAAILVSLGWVLLLLAPVWLTRHIRKCRARERQALGLPAEKSHDNAVGCVFLLLLFTVMGIVLIPSMLQFVAKDKLIAANNAAKRVVLCAQAYEEIYEDSDRDAPHTCIRQFSDESDDLAAYLHEALGADDPGGWYAIVCLDGEVCYALYSGHELTAADLHEPDWDEQIRILMRPGARAKDAIGYCEAVRKESRADAG